MIKMSIATLVVAAALLTGCSCNERVYVQNNTNETLHVQIQLPKPKLPWACGCKCVYETLVGPGGTWKSARPGSPDQMEHPIEAYSECTVVRARTGVSGPWTRFTLCGQPIADSANTPVMVTVTPGGMAGLAATAASEKGQTVDVATDVVEDF